MHRGHNTENEEKKQPYLISCPFLCQFIKHREGVSLFPREIFFFSPLKQNAESFGHSLKCSWVWFVVQRSKCAVGHDLPSVPVVCDLCTQRGVFV